MATRPLSTLITNVRTEILEPISQTPPNSANTGQWSDTEISNWLNEANQDLTEAAEIESPAANIVTVASTESYALPADFLRLRRVEIQDTAASTLWAPLVQMTIDQRLPNTISGAITGRGRPSGYFLYAGQIYLIPIPDAVYTLNVFYYRRAPDLLISGDLPIIDQRFHFILEFYAEARAKQKIDDPGYVTYDARYAASRASMLAKLTEERNTEGPLVVREI
jgi:hypothetical protein